MKKTIPIAQIEEKVRGWTALVQVLDRSHILVSEENPTISCRRFVFVDLDGTRVSAVAYYENIPPSSTHLIPLKKYYVSGATLKKATESDKIGPYQFTWTINHNTFIEPYEDGLVEEMFWPIEYQKFGNLQRFIDIEDLQNIQGLVAHAFDVKEIGLQTISRDIVLVNNERIPIILTLWNTYAANEGYQLASTVSAGNVVLAMRVKVTTLHGLSLSTRAGSSILINPPTPEAAILRQWARIPITIEDGTGSIDAVAYGQDAEKLIGKTERKVTRIYRKEDKRAHVVCFIRSFETNGVPNSVIKLYLDDELPDYILANTDDYMVEELPGNNQPDGKTEIKKTNTKECVLALAAQTAAKDGGRTSKPETRRALKLKTNKNAVSDRKSSCADECSGSYLQKKKLSKQTTINSLAKKKARSTK
ncbi:Unknown protein [Striga hermonthica]|uniref:Uncharacterized protein n=1 Tax=Striga hermonthica TaxID=68872 RepID=A0A9N7NUV3_STRHE|nr:Unknown protein [Striga hermonthica]